MSILPQLLELGAEERRAVIADMSEGDALALLYDFEGMWARPQQIEPRTDVPWLAWLLLGGRGSGKTRPASEWCIKRAQEMPGSRGFVAARTLDDVRNTCFEGDSGILANLHPAIGRQWNRTTCELTVRVGDVGSKMKGFSSEKPAQGRGPQHHYGWCDELAAWLKEGDLYDQLMFGLRLPWPGRSAQCVIATTPLPIERIRALIRADGKRVKTQSGEEFIECVVTRMTTYDNLDNLDQATQARLLKYEGTRLGRQELFAELLDDTPGAFWRRSWFERKGFRPKLELSDFEYLAVGIDPAITSTVGDEGDSDMTGIVAGGRLKRGKWLGVSKTGEIIEDTGRDHYAVIADWTMRAHSSDWSRAAVELYDLLGADEIVAETNRGGDLVESVVRQQREEVKYVGVTASRGKLTRAEPISTMYEQGRVHHAARPIIRAGDHERDFSTLVHLEDQFCTWVKGLHDSPDRLDAAVWMLTQALEGSRFVGL